MTKPADMTDTELVEAVAWEVMGWERMLTAWKTKGGLMRPDDWNPTYNANHRDEVMERMRELGFWMQIKSPWPARPP